jgi:hypothetical protein
LTLSRSQPVQSSAQALLQQRDISAIGEDTKAAPAPCLCSLDRAGKDAGGLAVTAARGNQPVDRDKEIRVVKLAGNAHAVGQIEMPEPADIDTLDGHDRFGIRNASGGLDQRDDESAFFVLAYCDRAGISTCATTYI